MYCNKLNLLLLLSVVFFSCSKISKKNYDNKILISVDTLLIETITDTSFFDLRLAIPKGWETANKNVVNAIFKNNLSQGLPFIDIMPIIVYSDSTKKNICLLSKYKGNLKKEQFIEVLYNNIFNHSISDHITDSHFTNNGIDIYQMMIFNSNYINVKLIFQIGNHIYLYEFITSISYYKKNIRNIESSIGQLKRRQKL